MTKNTFAKKIVIGAALTGFMVFGGTGLTEAQTPYATAFEQAQQATKYPMSVMEVLRINLGVAIDSTEADNQINTLPKVSVMDQYLVSMGQHLEGSQVRTAVDAIFAIDLNLVSEMNYGQKLNIYPTLIMESLRTYLNVPTNSTVLDAQIMGMSKASVMDAYIEVNGYDLTGAENRVLINQVFGVNLDGISGAEGAQMSIYSKGIWVLQADNDLFVISSSLDDVSLYVNTTAYFATLTGSTQAPASLDAKLISFGFTFNAVTDRYEYTNPTGESAPDAFKGQAIGAIMGAIAEFNQQ